jgi:Flp pilus assembly protein TadG
MAAMTSLVKRFRGDRQGSVALMFGFAALVLIAAVGVAMDYSRAGVVQTNLQRVVDGAALLAAKTYEQSSATLTSDASATEYVRKSFNTERISDLNVKITFLSESVRVDATAIVPTTLMNVFGFKTMPVGATSEALYNTKAEVILVLDNTGSMSALNKLQTLKDAANNFLTKMENTTSGGDSVRIGIVPFETNVNLGSMKTSWWVDPAQTAYWTANPATAGCIWDRDQPNDVKDFPPNPGVPSTLYSPDSTRTTPCNMAPILPLTTDFAALRASINGMAATGTTNLTIGLVWGFHLLSPSEPVVNALPFGTKSLTKYIVLMTDGDNTKMRGTIDVAVMDARTRQACDAAKAEKIVIVTARIIQGNDSLLRDCASSPELFFPVEDVSQLNPFFQKLYETITGARITR